MVQQNLLDLLSGRGIPTDREPRSPQTGGTGGTGLPYFSIIDQHRLTEDELTNSNLVLGADGFVWQAILGEGPFAGQIQGYELAPKWLQEEILGDDGGASGARGPTAAELAIERSRVQAQNLSTFIQGTIAELSNEIDSKRLSTEQALGEFNKRLDAFAEAGEQFVGIQPFTITPGSKFLPGRGPGDIGEAIGRPTLEASPVDFDPFGMANQIVAESPSLTDIGVPTGNALDEAIAIARGFLGG